MFDPAFDPTESECSRLLRFAADQGRHEALRLFERLADQVGRESRLDLFAGREVLLGESSSDALARYTSPLFRGWFSSLERSRPGTPEFIATLRWTNNMCVPSTDRGTRPLLTEGPYLPTWLVDRCLVQRSGAWSAIPTGVEDGGGSGVQRTGRPASGSRIFVDCENPLLRGGLNPGMPTDFNQAGGGENDAFSSVDAALEVLKAAAPHTHRELEALIRVVVTYPAVQGLGRGGIIHRGPLGGAWIAPHGLVNTIEALVRIACQNKLEYLWLSSPLVIAEADSPPERLQRERRAIEFVFESLGAAGALRRCVRHPALPAELASEMAGRSATLVSEARAILAPLDEVPDWTDLGERFLDWARDEVGIVEPPVRRRSEQRLRLSLDSAPDASPRAINKRR